MRSTLKDSGQRQRIVSGYANGGAGNSAGFSNGVMWTSTRDSVGSYTLKLNPPPGLTLVSLTTMVASAVPGYATQAAGTGAPNTFFVKAFATTNATVADVNYSFTATYREDLT